VDIGLTTVDQVDGALSGSAPVRPLALFILNSGLALVRAL